MHAANAGDCRVVLSRKGVAVALTSDHRPGRDDERRRIESSVSVLDLPTYLQLILDNETPLLLSFALLIRAVPVSMGCREGSCTCETEHGESKAR